MNKLQLSYPINPINGNIRINQQFGVNAEMYNNPKYGGIAGHNGIDFWADHGTPVYASHDGLASFQIDSGGGHGVVIITDKEFDWQGDQAFFKTIYWHFCDGLKEPKFASPLQGKTGFTPVKNGDLIGYADNTGASMGDHLHFGLKPVAKGEAWGTWYNLDQNNGYSGAIDPSPYFDGSNPAIIANLEMQLSFMQKVVDLLKELLSLKK